MTLSKEALEQLQPGALIFFRRDLSGEFDPEPGRLWKGKLMENFLNHTPPMGAFIVLNLDITDDRVMEVVFIEQVVTYSSESSSIAPKSEIPP